MTMRISRKRPVWAALLVIGLTGGCGGDPGLSSLVPVKGTLTRDGQPLANAIITFLPDSSNEHVTIGTDTTGTDGTFSMTHRNHQGVAPGKYKVVVERPADQDPAAGLPAEVRDDPQMAAMATGRAYDPEKPATDWPYADANTTPFSHEVPPGGDQGLNFDIKK